AEEVARVIAAAEEATRLLQATKKAGRFQLIRSFAAGFAGSTVGRLLREAVNFLNDNGWFGLAG
ncbi:hypothetical protein ACFWVM_33600, partial [Nocardia fluminea]|uniref:hypothetical protein n=1 Tax=Nocardia fluminea TaxID=134984 RepID=UPI0036527F32